MASNRSGTGLVARTIDELRVIQERAPWTAHNFAEALCEKCGGSGRVPTDYSDVKQGES